jgi:PhnB protein
MQETPPRGGGKETEMANVKSIPDGIHTLTPALIVRNGQAAVEYYKTAFGAKVNVVAPGPDGKGVMHADLQIGNSRFFLGDENPAMGALSPQTLGGSPVSLNIYTEDCDAMFNRAVANGAKVTMPIADMFWGDRYGKLTDPFGHNWGIATHQEDVAPGELERRMKEAFSATKP